MDNALPLTLGFIFLAAFVGIVFQRRRRDRCLKDFEAFRVTIELGDGKLVWGRLSVFPNGIELFYPEPNPDDAGHDEYSFVVFGEQLKQVRAIYRYHDELSETHQAERIAEVERSYRPTPVRRTLRWLRNLLNTFGDAFSQSMGAWLASAKKTSGSTVIQSQDKQLQKIGTTVLDAAGNSYEPILERYIGRRVVVEELRGEEWIEHAGILKEYTAQYIEVLDIKENSDFTFSLSRLERMQMNRNLDFIVAPLRNGDDLVGVSLSVENHGQADVVVKRCEGPGFSKEIGALLRPGATLTEEITELPPGALGRQSILLERLELRADQRLGEVALIPDRAPVLPDIRLIVQAARAVDLIMPRSRAILRHGGEPLESWYEKLRRKRVEG